GATVDWATGDAGSLVRCFFGPFCWSASTGNAGVLLSRGLLLERPPGDTGGSGGGLRGSATPTYIHHKIMCYLFGVSKKPPPPKKTKTSYYLGCSSPCTKLLT